MKIPLLIPLAAMLSAPSLVAGSINVVHAGPRDVLKFQVNAAGASQDFTLAHGAETGSFLLPDKPSTIKGFLEEIPSLDIPPSDQPRIAILAPAKTGFTWHLLPAKPSPDKWAFRVVNLAPVPATLSLGGETLEIPAGGETPVEATRKSEIRVKIPDLIDASYQGSEPTGVVAFLCRDDEENWHAVFVPDR